MEKLENPKSRLEDPDFLRQILDAITTRVEDIITDPKWSDYYRDPNDTMERVRNGTMTMQKDMGNRVMGSTIVFGQDFRLTPDEIDILKQKIFQDYTPRNHG